jgi:hypothetical protein
LDQEKTGNPVSERHTCPKCSVEGKAMAKEKVHVLKNQF